MKEAKFFNITLKYPTEMYYDTDLLSVATIAEWQEKCAKERFIKWGLSYHPDRKAFIASYTDKGGKPSDPDPCVTQFGSTALSAHQKLFVVVDVLGFWREGYESALEKLEEVEASISAAVLRAFKK